jgi:hypothetical protein
MTTSTPQAPQPRQEDDLPMLSEAQRALVTELRAMRERAGMSLAELGRRTNYSKSSWERWLNGKRPAPLPAVIALAKACGCDPSRLIGTALAAESAPNPPPVTEPNHATGVDVLQGVGGAPCSNTLQTEPGARRLVKPGTLGRAAVVLAIGVAAGALAGGAAMAVRSSTSIRLGAANPAPKPGCVADSCGGLDPERTHCADDAQTVTFDVRPELTVNLRYSAACKAAWGQIVAARPGDAVTLHAPDGTAQTATVNFGTDVYTPMLPADDPAALWACGHSHDAQAPACTAPRPVNPQGPTTTARRP